MFQKLKNGQLVVHTKSNRQGKVVGQNGAEVVVEFIIGNNHVTKTRTTKLENIPFMELRPVEKQQKKIYAPYFDVQKFHTAFGHPVANEPQPMSAERAMQRSGYAIEELVEFLWATAQGSEEETRNLYNQLLQDAEKALNKCLAKGEFPVEDTLLHQVDAITDSNYFNYGTLVELGVNPKPVFEIVQNANMKKLGEDGKPIIDPVTNKIMKPEGWKENYQPEPLIRKEIERQIVSAERKKNKKHSRSIDLNKIQGGELSFYDKEGNKSITISNKGDN